MAFEQLIYFDCFRTIVLYTRELFSFLVMIMIVSFGPVTSVTFHVNFNGISSISNLHGQVIQRYQSLWKYSAHFKWSRNKCRYAYCVVHYERLHKGGDNSVNG
jgi:hypothetical protein